MSTRFLTLTFDGGRFLKHSTPVTVLAELVTVQQLLFRVARSLYLQRHSERRRVPRGFPEAAELYLLAAEANCYTAVLDRPGTWPGAKPEDLAIFDLAGEILVDALEAPWHGTRLPEGFPASEGEILASFGSSLEDDEKILLSSPTGRAARVDRESRSRLAILVHRSPENVETLEGEVEQVDDALRQCVIRDRRGRRLTFPTFELAYRDMLLEALTQRPILRIRLKAAVLTGPPPRIRKAEELELVEVERAPDVLKLWERLKSFERISEGWLDGEGRPPSPHSIQLARGVLARLLLDFPGLPRPTIFPSPSGGVQAEWILGRWAVELSFDPEQERITVEATHADNGEDRTAFFEPSKVHADEATLLGNWLSSLDGTETVYLD